MLSSSTNDKSNELKLRRFPENNIISNSINNNNNNVDKSDTQHNLSHSRSDSEEDRKVTSLYLSTYSKPSSLRPINSDATSNRMSRKSITSDSSTNTLTEEPSYQNSSLPSQSRIAPTKPPKPYLPNITGKILQSKTEAVDVTDSSLSDDVFVSTVIKNGKYLQQTQWNNFIGSEKLKKYSKKIIERNDNIWEMVSLHYGCLNRLVILKEVYADSYPYMAAGPNNSNRSSVIPKSDLMSSERHGSLSERSNNFFESIESIVPGLKPLIKCFAKITNNLIINHTMRPDYVITDIGRVLNESITDDLCSELAKLYGHFNFQRQIASQKISQFKKYPVFLSYIHACERDPKSEKKTLPDYIQDISMFWARMTVPLNIIIEKTMNDSQEVNYLNQYKEKIQKLITEAENISGKFVNAQVLRTIIENYERNPECKESERVFEFMNASSATLLYKGEVQFELKKGGTGRVVYRDLTGVALENCLFFLISISEPVKNTTKYQLFQDRDRDKFPALLEWGQLYGYFREEDSKNTDSFSFYVIIEKPEPSIRRFFVSTTTERNCWKNCMMQGFSRWQNENSLIKSAEDKLTEELGNISTKWNNTQHGLELIKALDHSLKVQLEYRTVGFRTILEEELKRLSVSGRNSNTSTTTVTDGEPRRDLSDGINYKSLGTYIPDLSSEEGINDWLDVFVEWVYNVYRLLVNRLKFSLCSSGANITRSASEIEARKRPSIQTVKKCETFTSHDSPTYEKRPADVAFLNPPITKQKKDQRRISVSGFTNFFRIKNIKHEDFEKGNDSTTPLYSDGMSDKDMTDLSNYDAELESDSFMSNLSKDTVAAFSEINEAAKNITNEVIRLRSELVNAQAVIKKFEEEIKAYKEFASKIVKSSEGQIGSSSTASVYANSILNFTSSESMSESMENSTDNSASLTNQVNQMAECRRQTENLRQMYEQFANEKKKWEKEYETQKMKIEKEKDNIAEQISELKKRKDKLIEDENKHKEKCVMLQKKLDMHKQYGINIEEEVSFSIDDKKVVKKDDISQSSPHSRSHSDDVSHKRSSQSPISPPLASVEIASYSLDSRPHVPDIHSNNQIPDQLRGSLINQTFFPQRSSIDLHHKERQSLKTNSSDNILDSRAKYSNNNYPTQNQKMTPSIERKERCSNNMSFINDDEEKNWVSDIDDSSFQSRKNVSIASNQSISKPEDKSSIKSSFNSTTPTSNRVPSVYNNQQPILGIPRDLADKSKVKKDKSKKNKK